MNKKLMLKYIVLFLPFFIGGMLFCLGVFNLFSALLFFWGGYVAIKNSCDYRKVKKNINSVNDKCVNFCKKNNSYRTAEDIVGFKRTRRYHKVRKRVKNIDF